MKISVILGVYRRSEELDLFVKSFANQTSKKFELIFIIDTNIENGLTHIFELQKKYKVPIKIIFNSKRQGRTQALIDGLSIATGNYSIFVSTSDVFKTTFIEKLIAKAAVTSADIIEFRPKFKGLIKWEPNLRFKSKKIISLSDSPEVFAYTFPFNFNKLFKTKLIRSVANSKLYKEINSRFAHEMTFLCLYNAKTYSTINESLIVSNINTKTSFNPLAIMRLWKSILVYYESEKKYLPEITYNMYYHSSIILMKMIVASKNKILFTKFHNTMTKTIENKYKNELISNKYIHLDNEESNYLSMSKNKQMILKINKEIK